MKVFVIPLAISVHLAFAGSALQTDWLGGPGVLGPVTDWGSSFHIGDDLDWDNHTGAALSRHQHKRDIHSPRLLGALSCLHDRYGL